MDGHGNRQLGAWRRFGGWICAWQNISGSPANESARAADCECAGLACGNRSYRELRADVSPLSRCVARASLAGWLRGRTEPPRDADRIMKSGYRCERGNQVDQDLLDAAEHLVRVRRAENHGEHQNDLKKCGHFP